MLGNGNWHLTVCSKVGASFSCLLLTEKWIKAVKYFNGADRAKLTSCFVLGFVSFSSQWRLISDILQSFCSVNSHWKGRVWGPLQVIPFTICPGRGWMEWGAGQLISGRSRAGGDVFSILFSRLNSFGWKGFYCYHHIMCGVIFLHISLKC